MSPADVETLSTLFSGELITPGQPDYDAARKVFNAAIDRRPAVIARPRTAQDVAHAVNVAREHGLVVSVRCSGHNVAGFAVCDDGLMIDLSWMKRIDVDPAARVVRVEGGATWGEVNDALQPHELAATGGFVSITGVSGLTLGGGLGWLVRKHGLAIDNLLSAQVVLADGRIVTASASENPDLFWAIRGGGGNFGVVTSFEFQVHPAGTVLSGILLHPAARAPEALRVWREFETTSPEELTQGALLFHFPDDPSSPLRGASLIGFGGVYAGPIDAGEKALQSLRAYGPPLADLFQPTPYNVAQRMADFVWPPGLHNYWKSAFLESLSDGAIQVISDFFARVPSRQTVVVIEHDGDGAMDRVPESATAFGHRTHPYNFVITSAWSDPGDTDRNVAWTREFFDAMRPFMADAVYVNFIGDEGAEGVRMAYGAEKHARLATVKMRYDPRNLFRMNQNSQPAVTGRPGVFRAVLQAGPPRGLGARRRAKVTLATSQGLLGLSRGGAPGLVVVVTRGLRYPWPLPRELNARARIRIIRGPGPWRGERHDHPQEITGRLRHLAARPDTARRRGPRLQPGRRHRPGAVRLQQGERSGGSHRFGQDPGGVRMVRRQRRAEHDRAVRGRDVLQASPDHRHQREEPSEDRCTVRLAEV